MAYNKPQEYTCFMHPQVVMTTVDGLNGVIINLRNIVSKEEMHVMLHICDVRRLREWLAACWSEGG
jgi:hypothetical protein